MKRQVLMFVLLPLLVATAASAGDRVQLMVNTDEAGRRSYYMADAATLEKCPSWDLKVEPPLPVTEAVAKAKDWLKRKQASFLIDDVTSIGLMKIWATGVKDKWCYSIHFQGRASVDGIPGDKNFLVVVLMDGSIVQPSDKKE